MIFEYLLILVEKSSIRQISIKIWEIYDIYKMNFIYEIDFVKRKISGKLRVLYKI